MVGEVEQSMQAYKLRKPALALSSNLKASTKAYDVSKWFACLILSAVESQGARKFIIRDDADATNRTLRVWVFAPGLSISSSGRSSTEPVRVAKVLWQDCEAPVDMSDRSNASAMSDGDLTLQNGELALLRDKLREGGELLPEGARKFQEWHVGLLPRFTSKDIEPL